MYLPVLVISSAVGLHNSHAQYKAFDQSHDRSKAGSKPFREDKLEEVTEGREGIRHRSKGKKPKKMKLQFDEVVMEVRV